MLCIMIGQKRGTLTLTAEYHFKGTYMQNYQHYNRLWPTLQPCVGSLLGAGVGFQHPLHDEGAAPLPLLLPP